MVIGEEESADHGGHRMRLSKICGVLLILLETAMFPALLNGQAPLAADPYVPLSVSAKAKIFGYRIIAPGSLAKSAFTAGINHWQDSPTEWGRGFSGYGRRYGHKLATRGVENTVGLAVASALGEDPRYFRLSEGTVGRRLSHALTLTILTRTDAGGQRPAIWRFTANYGAQFVSNTWRPDRDTQLSDTLLRGTVSIGYDAASNLLKEFWPDIRRRLFHR
jgi:hypothetical protein